MLGNVCRKSIDGGFFFFGLGCFFNKRLEISLHMMNDVFVELPK